MRGFCCVFGSKALLLGVKMICKIAGSSLKSSKNACIPPHPSDIIVLQRIEYMSTLPLTLLRGGSLWNNGTGMTGFNTGCFRAFFCSLIIQPDGRKTEKGYKYGR